MKTASGSSSYVPIVDVRVKTHMAGFIILMELVQADHTKKQKVNPMTDEPNEKPKNFQGWTVQRSKDGFIRLYKSFKGKVKSLYIGRVWDESKASEKIREIITRLSENAYRPHHLRRSS